MSSANVPRIGLVNNSSKSIDFSEITEVARALQIQMDHDYTPIWGVGANITAYPSDDAIPTDVWPISLVDVPKGGLGIHLNAESGQPFAEVQATNDWSLTASHELLEMVTDPYGRNFKQGRDITPKSDGHLVSYLVEVGDPCEIYSYNILNVQVSDFVTPSYYSNPFGPPPSPFVMLDFMRKLTKPYEVPSGCYLSWQDHVDNSWHQKNTAGKFTIIGKIDPNKNPRQDRDDKSPEDEESERHDLAKILKAHSKSRK